MPLLHVLPPETNEASERCTLSLASCNLAALFRRFGLLLLLALVPVVLALEFLDAAGGVHELHLAGEEWVARGTDFDGDVFLGAAGDELVAAAAGDGALFVFRVDVLLHGLARIPGILGREIQLYREVSHRSKARRPIAARGLAGCDRERDAPSRQSDPGRGRDLFV